MRIIVSGAAGFLGRYVCNALVASGYSVAAVGGPASSVPPAGFSEWIQADLRDERSVHQIINPAAAVVIHLAAVLPRGFWDQSAHDAAQVNCLIDTNVFRAAKKAGAVVVFASGTSVYGSGDVTPRNECSEVAPSGPYVAAKLASEELGATLLGNSFCALRISAPYGSGQRAKTVLQVFVDRAVSGQPLMYHGLGSRQQDFTHAADVALAFVQVIRTSRMGIYNIASGEPVSMRRLAELVVDSVPGCRSAIMASGQDDPQEGASARFATDKARRELGWEPRIALSEGLRALALERLRQL